MNFPGLKAGWLDCPGYEVLGMSLWRCLVNQLSDYCLPSWPCHSCQFGVGIEIAPVPPPSSKKRQWPPPGMSRAVAIALGLMD